MNAPSHNLRPVHELLPVCTRTAHRRDWAKVRRVIGVGMCLFALAQLFGAHSAMGATKPAHASAKAADTAIVTGKRVAVKGTPFSVRFDTVIDSRCPSDVNCVWEGELKVGMQVFGPLLPKAGRDVLLTARPSRPYQGDAIALVKGWWFGIDAQATPATLRIQRAKFA